MMNRYQPRAVSTLDASATRVCVHGGCFHISDAKLGATPVAALGVISDDECKQSHSAVLSTEEHVFLPIEREAAQPYKHAASVQVELVLSLAFA